MKSLSVQGSNAQDIAASFESLMRSGELQQGDALPAVRHLATQLGVNPNTVASAYARLRDAGRIVTAGRRGTRVAGEAAVSAPALGVPEGLRDLASGQIDATLLPQLRASTWNKMRVVQDAGEAANALQDDPLLHSTACDWLSLQGLPDQDVGVFSGTLDAMERALRHHARPGDRVAIEDPCWPPLLALLRSLRLRPVPLAVDVQGACVPAAGVLASCAAVVLTPRAHNPTGVALSSTRWRALRRQLRSCPNTLVIFNDHWGPLSQKPLVMTGALPPLWLYAMSLGKSLGSDLRVCVTSGSNTVVHALRAQQAMGPRWVSHWLQGLAAQLWRQAAKGTGRGSLAMMTRTYAARRAALAQALQARGLSGTCAQGEGLHVWMPVVDELSVVQALAARGWAVQAGGPLRLESASAVRISLGHVSLRDIKTLAADLDAALSLRERALF